VAAQVNWLAPKVAGHPMLLYNHQINRVNPLNSNVTMTAPKHRHGH